MFVGTSPAFDFAMFSTCFIRGMVGAAPWAHNCRVTNCDCQINAGGVMSNVEMRAIERQANPNKVCTVFPTNVICKSLIAIITNCLLKVSQATSAY